MTSSLSNIKVFTTHPHECSYLDEKKATTQFVDPKTIMDRELYSHLSQIGFRRSGSYLYRPDCGHCNACIACRVPVDKFKLSRSQKRIWKKNQDLSVCEVKGINTEKHYELYEKYINERHSDGDMFPADSQQYASFLGSEWNLTRFIQFSMNDKLLGIAVIDELNDGLSAIYTFFDPDEDVRSLGTYAVLWQLEMCKTMKLPYLYLGYWIKGCQKMSYKTRYRPLELLINEQWVNLA